MSLPATRNLFKTSDIRISTDSAGCMTAEHRYQGTLIDGDYFADRAACRRAAVEVLKEKKEDDIHFDVKST